MADTLVIKVTAGADDAERSNQAFTVAAAACAADVRVELWLTGEAAWFSLPGRAADLRLEFATPVEDLLEMILTGGTVTLCTQCAARRGITAADVRPGIRIAGAASFVEAIMRRNTQALVY